MLAQVALVGRPNVGKSSLFNRLAKRDAALTDTAAGTTKDRLYETILDKEHGFILVDSPGHRHGKQELDRLMAEQAAKAWETADLVLLVCEAQRHNEDDRILTQLRQVGAPVLLLINKLDHQAGPAELAEFYPCGVPLLGVSAQSGLGLKELLAAIKKRVRTNFPPTTSKKTPLAILGRPNVGKSTLVNRLLGTRQQLVHKEAGTTRDSVKLDFSWRGKDYSLIDTAGIRRRPKIDAGLEKMAVAQALSAAGNSDIILAMLDATTAVTNQDMALLQLAERLGKGLVIAINKKDQLGSRAQRDVSLQAEERLGFVSYADRHLISAKRNNGIAPLMRSVHQAQLAAGRRWKTPLLNKTLQECLARQQPPTRSQLRYAHQSGTHPPKIIIHGRRMNRLPSSYKRYLRNHLSLVLHIRGVPLRLQFKEYAEH